MLNRRTLGTVAAAVLLGGCATSRPGVVTTPDATTPPGSASEAAPSASAATSGTPASSADAAASDGSSGSTEPAPTASAPTKAPSAAPAASPFAINGVVLVNRSHPLLPSYVPTLVGNGAQRLTPAAMAAMTKLLAGAEADGMSLKIRSGYRSWREQQAIFEQALKDNDEETARRYFAEPGKSEHQTGLAADLWDGVHRGSAFTALPQAAWLAKHCTDYGFILRYPDGKESITQVAYESWHMRYVGPDAAKAFAASPGLTLEEYLGQA